MTQEDKQLLLVDLCARLPYGVKVKQGGYVGELGSFDKYTISFNNSCALPKPYLRPISSMTEEEKKEHRLTYDFLYSDYPFDDEDEDEDEDSIEGHYEPSVETFDWYNKNHFDYRGLISKGLAIEVTKENNPYKK